MNQKINIKKKITISLSTDELCELITKLPMKDRVYIMHDILTCYRSNENPLKEFVKNEYKCAKKDSKTFLDISKDPMFGEGYKETSDKYNKEAEMWKRILAEIE